MKRYERKNRPWLAGALVSILISTLFAVTLQFFKGEVLDRAIAGDGEETARRALLLVLFILLEVLFFYLYRRLADRFAAGCVTALKEDVFQSVLRLDYPTYKQRPLGEYISKYTTEADNLRSRRFCMLPILWEIVLKLVLVSAALFALDWRMALLTLALLTTPLYVPKLIEKKLQKAQTAFLRAAAEAVAGMTDWLNGFELIKNFAIEDKVSVRFRRLNANAADKLLRDLALGAQAQLLTTLISYLSYFCVLACAAWLVLRGEFSAGDFFVAVGMIDQLSYPLIALADVVRQLAAVRPACAAMEDFLDRTPAERPKAAPRTMERDIRLRGVVFGYEGQPPVLDGLDLTLRKGERCLLKGPSGCGKTTVINLMLRYYSPEKGSITIDEVPIEAFGSVYDCITVMRQEAILFHDTLRNNLTMYRDVPEERLTQVLNSLGLEKYSSPEALELVVQENGANFSGGEKKRICLARALLRDTPLLILDEPLANLDSGTVRQVEELLLSIEGKTLLIVSHQFSGEKLDRFDQVADLSGRR